MTRSQIADKILEILERNQRIKWNSGNGVLLLGTEEAVAEIMRLWDKGFTYDV